MKNLYRIMAIVMAICLITSVLTACGSSTSKETQSTTTAATTAATQKVETPVPLEWKPQNATTAQPDVDNSLIIQEINKRFNIKLSVCYLDPGKEQELLNIRIASGQVPDVMYLSYAAQVLQQFVTDGVITDIPVDRFKQFAPQLYDVTEKVGGSNVFDYYTIDGKLYGMPYLSPDGKYCYVPIWRDDWLKNVGIDKIPETLEEAEEAFYKFVKNDPDKNGKNDTYAISNTAFPTVYGAFGGLGPQSIWIKKDNGVVLSGAIPGMKDALALLNKWYKDGLIDPEFISGENKGQYWANSVTFWNGKIGFSIPGSYYHVNHPLYEGDLGSGNYQNFVKLQSTGSYTEGIPLKGANGQQGLNRFSYMGGSGVVFGKGCKDDPAKMEKALQILEATNFDEDFYVYARWGREGIDYDVKNGLPIAKSDKGEELAKLGLGLSGVVQLQNNHSLYRKYNSKTELITYADKAATVTSNYENAVFVSLPSYSQYKANIDKKVTENYALFITGQRSLSEWDKFIEELNQEGLTQLTKEANEWYNKYNK